MEVWILVVALVNGRTIGSPFETEKQCKAALIQVSKTLKNDKNIASISCEEGTLSPEDSSAKKQNEVEI